MFYLASTIHELKIRIEANKNVFGGIQLHFQLLMFFTAGRVPRFVSHDTSASSYIFTVSKFRVTFS